MNFTTYIGWITFCQGKFYYIVQQENQKIFGLRLTKDFKIDNKYIGVVTPIYIKQISAIIFDVDIKHIC